VTTPAPCIAEVPNSPANLRPLVANPRAPCPNLVPAKARQLFRADNRGVPGLRRGKCSSHPHHLWARRAGRVTQSIAGSSGHQDLRGFGRTARSLNSPSGTVRDISATCPVLKCKAQPFHVLFFPQHRCRNETPTALGEPFRFRRFPSHGFRLREWA
jgi:hypothetical protein